jgi:SAM-dependent methyltransferase
MDLPGNEPAVLEEDLRNLRILNRYLGGYRCIRKGLQEIVRKRQTAEISLLDVGTGSGDIPAAIVHWARAKGITVRIVALEPDPITVNVAVTRTRLLPEISIVRGDASAPPFPPASFDCVLASQLLHHFSEDGIVSLLKTWSQLARQAIIIGDLVRDPVAYYGIQWLTRLCTRNPMTLTDAPLSVKRAFTVREWRELFRRAAVGSFQITPIFPYRIMGRVWLGDSR